ncbi:MAG TPA: ABC transporter permease [Thermoanaerobaculia bacterium]|nr:ABC transporter permease [Thermoanaerobaculia bacterium]
MNPSIVSDLPLESPAIVPPPITQTRPMYWSIRRELWENRSVYLAPLAVAAFVLFVMLIGTLSLPKKFRNLPNLEPAKQHAVVTKPYNFAPAPIMFSTFLVGLIYALDALYGERRDRSILFWKSMPVSDTTSVLAKAAIPMVVLPLIGLVLSIVTSTILFLVSNAWLVMNGVSPAPLWREVHVILEPIIMAYGLGVHALWFAPIYGYLLLVSAWARRTPFLWAVLPPVAIGMVERLSMGSTHFGQFVKWRWAGAMATAFGHTGTSQDVPNIESLSDLTPGTFLTTPGLWIGLFFMAACLAAAVRLRRNREAI